MCNANQTALTLARSTLGIFILREDGNRVNDTPREVVHESFDDEKYTMEKRIQDLKEVFLNEEDLERKYKIAVDRTREAKINEQSIASSIINLKNQKRVESEKKQPIISSIGKILSSNCNEDMQTLYATPVKTKQIRQIKRGR